ncbi:MAG: flagellar biosynthesis protein FliQ [Firmicutes bacterium]|nr:flagellar biosynthesis protein FliQ [Bacillota bacterium]
MDGNFVIGLGQQVIMMVLELAGPILLVGIIVGLVISIFQATTQISEQTLVYFVKTASIILILLLAGPWMMSQMLNFTTNILGNLQQYIR